MAQNFHNSTKIEPLSIEYSELLGNDEEENNFQQNTISIFENMKVHKEKIAFLMIFTILIIVLVVSVSLSISNGPVFNVVLFGDSLIGNTESMYHIASKIKSNILVKYPDKAINIFTSGIGGNRIADLKNRMYRDALHKSNFQLIPTQQFVHPDAVVMYWDSDATDVDETGHVTEIRAEYTANLYEVLSTLKEQVKYFAFGGPSLYGHMERIAEMIF